MIEYKQSTQVFAPVRLLDNAGAPQTGKLYTDVTAAIMKSGGAEATLTLGAADFVELTTGAFANSGSYRLRLSTSNTDTTGVFLYVVRCAGALDYVGVVKIVANEEVDTFTLMVRGIGLMHENSVLDNTTYNTDNRLTSGRMRIYDSRANALAAGATGLVATYTITATYSGLSLTNYTVVKEP